GKFVSAALKNEKVRSKFDFGSSLKIERQKVCALSGKLPGSACKKTVEEVFIKDTVPDEVCNDHAGLFGPPDVLEPPDLGEPENKKKKKKKSKNKNMFQGDEKID
ncbi:MAG TPA: carboxypeptidase, partial [Leptospiraceae bacterium]|nr:carboxypeptidase [Leptospiraceae bacterium]